MAGLFEELKRRNVVRVAVAYLAAAWLILQVLDLVIESVAAPPWVMQLILALFAIGFPVVLVFSWAYEITPEGLKRERDVDRSRSIAAQTGHRLDRVIVMVLVIAIGVVLVDRFVLRTPMPDSGPAATSATEVPETPNERRSIAVLPFANRSATEDDAFFVDGIHDDILTQLAKISALKVISRTSVMQYRDTDKSMRTIGEELSVSSILEGSVQRAGDRVRINVQLIDADTDEHVWADVYNRELTVANIFEIQEEIATAIAGELRANLTDREARRIALRPTGNLQAYEAYLLGRQYMAKRTTDEIARARGYFEEAISLDPAFALAYVGVSDTIILQVDYAGANPATVAEEAEPYVLRALELDPDAGEALFSLASVYEYRRDYEAAAELYERGLALAPNYSQGRMWYGLYLASIRGQPENALDQFLLAAESDPLSAINYTNISAVLDVLGRFDESRRYVDRAEEVDGRYGFGSWRRGEMLWTIDGKISDAVAPLFRAWNLDRGNFGTLARIIQFYAELGDDDTAWCWMDKAVALDENGAWTRWSLTYLTALRGDLAAAAEIGLPLASELYRRADMAMPLGVVKAHLLADGRPDEAIRVYERQYAEFGEQQRFEINTENYFAAIEYADLLMRAGQAARAARILNDVELRIKTLSRLGTFGRALTDVQIFAVRGDYDSAIKALESAVGEGWRFLWRYYYEIDSTLEPIRLRPEFASAFAIIEQEMAAHLEKVRAWETIETRCSDQ